jgi:hypothetical protein
LVSKEKYIEVSKNVTRFVISDNGECIAYMTSNGDDTSTLMLFNSISNKSEKIADNVAAFGGISISPDGKTVSYIADVNVNITEYNGYVSINGDKPVNLGKNIICFKVSNNAEYIYYFKYLYGKTNDIFVKKGAIETKLASNQDKFLKVNFNIDYSEIVFESDENFFISKKGNAPKRLSSKLDFFIGP